MITMSASPETLRHAGPEARKRADLAAARKLAVVLALTRGPLTDAGLAQVLADAGVPLPAEVRSTWPRTLVRDGVIERVDPRPGPPVWRLTPAARLWLAAYLEAQ